MQHRTRSDVRRYGAVVQSTEIFPKNPSSPSDRRQESATFTAGEASVERVAKLNSHEPSRHSANLARSCTDETGFCDRRSASHVAFVQKTSAIQLETEDERRKSEGRAPLPTTPPSQHRRKAGAPCCTPAEDPLTNATTTSNRASKNLERPTPRLLETRPSRAPRRNRDSAREKVCQKKENRINPQRNSHATCHDCHDPTAHVMFKLKA